MTPPSARLLLVALLLTGGCSRNDSGTVTAFGGGRSDEDQAAPERPNPCRLFTAKDIGLVTTLDVGEGKRIETNGCRWPAKSGKGRAIVREMSVADARDYPRPPGATSLPEVGRDGFVAKSAWGWRAGTTVGGTFAYVELSGDGVDDTTAAELLKETTERIAAVPRG
ncbi:hypothetical protein [Sphingomonas sp.]|uniref:hypothetical protein n=1 Tax=Sphingomonas sp. TaxID=28214 RepID=UPI003AFFCF64